MLSALKIYFFAAMTHLNTWPSETPKNIIVRMPNWLGDLVMATPVLADLRHHYKTASITALCQANVAPLIKEDPHIDEVLSFKRPSGWIHHLRHLDVVDQLQKGGYDLGVLLTNSFSSAWWFWRGDVRNRIGYVGNFRNFLLNKAVPWPKEVEKQHLVKTYKQLLEPLGIPYDPATEPRIYLTDAEIAHGKNLLALHGANVGENLIIGINPGAAYGTAKCWLPERFEAVTRRLLENPRICVVYFGDQSGAPLVSDICKKFPERVINLAGKTNLRELMSLIKLCSIFLTNDSGPMHIADALGTPLVALFGSTSDVKTGPYHGGKVIHKRVECSPCYKRICPIDFRCMKKIEVDEVYQELQQQLQANNK